MYTFKFADIGEGIHEGKILEWNYKVGDTAEEGETLVIIETDKINAEIPLPVDGKIVEIGPDIGQTVHVGDILAVIDTGKANPNGDSKTKEKSSEQKLEVFDSKSDNHKDDSADNEEAGVVGKLEVSDEVIGSQADDSSTSSVKSNRVLATPVARKLASDLGVDIQKVNGTGEHGRVLRTDIEQYHEKGSSLSNRKTQIERPKMVFKKEDRRESISTLRKAVVKAMTLSKQIVPHTTLMDELDITELVSFRNFYKQKAKEKGVKLTYMAFIIKALTKTIEQYPMFNSSFDQDSNEMIYKGSMNIGIAVDTPDGLIVPNIKNADNLSLFELANEVERLAYLAKERKIQMKDLQGGTISITNFGAFDAMNGTPIIKYPEVAILGIGKISKKPVVKDNEIVIGDVLPLSLTFDHRIIDGADGGRFMMQFKEYLRDPMLLLME